MLLLYIFACQILL